MFLALNHSMFNRVGIDGAQVSSGTYRRVNPSNLRKLKRGDADGKDGRRSIVL
jgi:hypothetical protein